MRIRKRTTPLPPPVRVRNKKGKFIGGQTARVLPKRQAAQNASTVHNYKFSLFDSTWRRLVMPKIPPKHKAATITPETYAAQLFGKSNVRPLAAGAYGKTFVLTLNAKTMRILHYHMEKELVCVIDRLTSIPAGTKKVLLKLARKKEFEGDMAEFYEENMREASAQLHLTKAPPTHLKTCNASLHAANYIPALYAFGIDATADMAVTVMTYIRGTPLRKVISSRGVTASLFLHTVKALSALYAAGVDHGDLHFHNILVRWGTASQVAIIDFGFASRLSELTRQEFIRFFEQNGGALTLDQAIDRLVTRTVNAIQYKRSRGGISFYNPTFTALRVLWSYMPSQEQQKILSLPPKQTAIACIKNIESS